MTAKKENKREKQKKKKAETSRGETSEQRLYVAQRGEGRGG